MFEELDLKIGTAGESHLIINPHPTVSCPFSQGAGCTTNYCTPGCRTVASC